MNAASLIVNAVLIVLTGGALLVGLAVGARRLLALQLGVVRTILAGLVGSAAWLTFGITIQRPQHRPLVLTTVQLGIALLAAMAFLVLAEAVVPSGSVRPLAGRERCGTGWPGSDDISRSSRSRPATACAPTCETADPSRPTPLRLLTLRVCSLAPGMTVSWPARRLSVERRGVESVLAHSPRGSACCPPPRCIDRRRCGWHPRTSTTIDQGCVMTTTAASPVPDVAACCAPLGTSGLSDTQAAATARVFKALADPHRVKIVNLLATSPEPVCVCEFTEPLGLSQPTVSHHLKKLVQAGLLEREQRGTWAYYRLRRDALGGLAAALDLQGGTR
jgi:ArsR family transcriptional regulator, arsenate/arsenite/antimonite-responsive transcriptional repressor